MQILVCCTLSCFGNVFSPSWWVHTARCKALGELSNRSFCLSSVVVPPAPKMFMPVFLGCVCSPMVGLRSRSWLGGRREPELVLSFS